MIHNCWVFAIGNRHALRNIADDMEEFDAAMVDLYVEGCGQSEKTIATMMDEETFIRGKKYFSGNIIDFNIQNIITR